MDGKDASACIIEINDPCKASRELFFIALVPIEVVGHRTGVDKYIDAIARPTLDRGVHPLRIVRGKLWRNSDTYATWQPHTLPSVTHHERLSYHLRPIPRVAQS